MALVAERKKISPPKPEPAGHEISFKRTAAHLKDPVIIRNPGKPDRAP